MEQSTNYRIAAIVVLFNPEKSVLTNISSYEKYVDTVIIVDNSFVNNQSYFSNYSYIPLFTNTGIAKALNVGIYEAIKQGYNCFVTMDQDSKFENNIIEEYFSVIRKAKGRKIGMMVPRYIYDRAKSSDRGKCFQTIRLAMQSAAMITVEVFSEIGDFCEDLFVDCVDYDYCYRLRNKGFEIIQCNEARLNHHPAETKLINFLFFELKYGQASPLRYYYQSRNLMYLFLRYKDFYTLVIFVLKLLKVLLLFNKKTDYLKMMARGLVDCYANRFGSYVQR